MNYHRISRHNVFLLTVSAKDGDIIALSVFSTGYSATHGHRRLGSAYS